MNWFTKEYASCKSDEWKHQMLYECGCDHIHTIDDIFAVSFENDSFGREGRTMFEDAIIEGLSECNLNIGNIMFDEQNRLVIVMFKETYDPEFYVDAICRMLNEHSDYKPTSTFEVVV